MLPQIVQWNIAESIQVPTPIANPGLASIKAALSPASTQALYYALDAESGTHKFFTNYGEFQAFVAKQSYSQ